MGLEPWGRLLSLVSAAMELASAYIFVRFVFRLIRSVREGKYDRRDPLLRFLCSGTLYLAVAMAFVGAQGLWLAGNADSVLPASLNEPFYFAALYGFLLAWIYGFGNRIVSLFLGVGPAVRGTASGAFALQAAGVVLAVLSWLPALSNGAALALRDAGLSCAALSALVYLAGNGFLWRRSTLPMLRTPGNPGFAIRAAFGSLGLWAVLQLSAVALSRLTSLPAQNLWWADAARHVFTIGFLTLLIVGMAFRILPVFSGKRLWSPGLAHATYALLLLGATMRLLQYPAAFLPALLRARLVHGDSRRPRPGPLRGQPGADDEGTARRLRPRDASSAARPSIALRVHAAGAIIRGVPARPPVPFSAVPILASLTAEDRAALDPLCELRAFEKGATLFEEGDPAHFIHFVILGRVKIVKAAGGRDVILEILGPGEPVGAVAVFERRPFPAGAVTLEGTRNLDSRAGVLRTAREAARDDAPLLAGLTYRLMMVNKRLADMTGSAEYRAARLFLTLADRVGLAREGRTFIPLPLSRQEIADLIGTTLETAIRLMSRWQKDEIVLTEKNGFLILQPDALRALAPEE